MDSDRQHKTAEQRDSFRCSTQAQPQAARLRVRGRDVAVRIVDRSAGGFAVACDKRISARVGQRLVLQTDGGVCRVEVVHKETAGRETRLGLHWIADLTDPRDVDQPRIGWWTISTHFDTRSSAGTRAGTMLALALGLIAIFWLTVGGLSWFGNYKSAEQLKSEARQALPFGRP